MFNIFSGEKPFLPWDTLKALFAAKNPGESNPVATLTDALPPGAIFHTAGQNAPLGSVKANGAALSRTAYAELFAEIGTTYGPGDGSTTFNVPDLRGEFLRGFDDGRGVDSGRTIGSAQLDALQNITGNISFKPTQGGALGSLVTADGAFRKVVGLSGYGTMLYGSGNDNADTANLNVSRVARTATETRPRNVALLACIKY